MVIAMKGKYDTLRHNGIRTIRWYDHHTMMGRSISKKLSARVSQDTLSDRCAIHFAVNVVDMLSGRILILLKTANGIDAFRRPSIRHIIQRILFARTVR